MKKNNIKVNLTNETIEVSSVFLKKASVYGTAEYTELKEVRDSEPTFKVKAIDIKKNASKKTYKKLTFNSMKTHIELIESDEKQREKALNELEIVITHSGTKGSSYPIVKKWFLAKYKDSYINFMSDKVNQKENKTETEKAGETENEVA